MVKIRIKSWEELEKIAKRKNAAGNMVIDGDAFTKGMSYLCNTTHMVDLSKSEISIDGWNITPNMYEVIEPSLIEMICEEIGVEVGEKRCVINIINNKTLNEIKEQLETLSQEIGVYAIGGSWEFYEYLTFQCEPIKLRKYAKNNNIELDYEGGREGFNIGKHRFFII